MKYYYNDNGEPKGPVEREKLVNIITPSTLVWTEGMSVWEPASQVPMLQEVLDGTLAKQIRERKVAAQQEELRRMQLEQSRRVAQRRPSPQAVKYNMDGSPIGRSNPEPVSSVAASASISGEPQYYAVVAGSQIGPVSLSQLKNYGVTPECMVWTEGMMEWMKARSVSEVMQVIAFEQRNAPTTAGPGTSCPPPPPVGQTAWNQSYRHQQYNNPMVPPPGGLNQFEQGGQYKNYMTSSIVSTLLGLIGMGVGLSGAWFTILFAIGTTVCGILAITKASTGNSLLRQGNLPEALKCASSAKSMLTVAYILFGVSVLIVIVTVAAGAAIVGMSLMDLN